MLKTKSPSVDEELRTFFAVQTEFAPSTDGADSMFVLQQFRVMNTVRKALFLQQLRCLLNYPRLNNPEDLLFMVNPTLIARAAIFAIRQSP